jgi:hypothetical protein
MAAMRVVDCGAVEKGVIPAGGVMWGNIMLSFQNYWHSHLPVFKIIVIIINRILKLLGVTKTLNWIKI